jgi:N-acetylneuraminic acid mutarotase
MVIFGGKNDENEKLNDVWVFDFSACTWTKHENGDISPTVRSGHSAVLYNNQMIVFGGIFEITRELNDVVALDLTTWKWRIIQNEHESQDASPTKYNTNMTGLTPLIKKTKASRIDKSSVFLPKNLTLDSPLKSKSSTIEAPTHDGKKKTSEYTELKSPSSVEMKNSFIIQNQNPAFDTYAQAMRRKQKGGGAIFGLQLTSGQKGISRQAGKRPAPRDGHTGMLCGSSLVVFGGDRHHMPFNDLFYLDIAS